MQGGFYYTDFAEEETEDWRGEGPFQSVKARIRISLHSRNNIAIQLSLLVEPTHRIQLAVALSVWRGLLLCFPFIMCVIMCT